MRLQVVSNTISPTLKIRGVRMSDFTIVNEKILDDGLARSQSNFHSASFFGDPWAALKESTIKKKERAHVSLTPLVESGLLFRTLFKGTTGNLYDAGPVSGEVVIDRPSRGANVAGIQQRWGTRGHTPRPFVGWDPSRIPVYRSWILDHLGAGGAG